MYQNLKIQYSLKKYKIKIIYEKQITSKSVSDGFVWDAWVC